MGRFPGGYAAGFIEVVLIALIGLQCATLFGALVTPPEPSRPRASDRSASISPSTILTSYDPFFGNAGASPAPAPAAIGLELYGVRQDGPTGRGSAIISEAGGPQKSFGVGEAISPGIVLKAVGQGYATVTRHGIDERLAFARPPSSNRASTPALPAGSAPGSGRPLHVAPVAGPGRSTSINFADPSTLPASLNPPTG